MTVKSLLINEADRPAQRAGSPSLESAISPENPIYQGDLAGTADTAGDVSTRNDSATARADTGNIRGICSPGVPAGETAEDRLDKIEAMVTDLFRQLRIGREAIGGFGQLVDKIAARVDNLNRRESAWADGIHRISKLESLKPFIVAAHERLDAVDTWRNQTSARIDEMAEGKATITDAQQIHNRINRMGERIDGQRDLIVRLLARIGKLEAAAVCEPIISDDFEERLAHLTEAVQQLQANEIERNERELNAAHEAMPAKRTIKGGWVNVYRLKGGDRRLSMSDVRDTLDEALATKGDHASNWAYVNTVQIPDITEGEGL